MDSSHVKVLIIDDQSIVRNGIKTMLEHGEFGSIIFSIDEANGSAEAKYIMRNGRFDLIILDYVLGDANGAVLCKQILSEYPNQKVLTLSNNNSLDFAHEMLQAGAKGYVLKSIDAKNLAMAISKILSGGLFFNENLANGLVERCILGKDKAFSTPHPAIERLSRREKEIIAMICDQLTNEQIAKQLFLSKRTIDNHRQNILNKLGMINTAGLVRFAVENGLANP
jgi:DNA-binding NarL/FixJ family response regulator